jgi:adenylate cyclase
VIGRAKFIYDLWGDTVNTASRMESHAPPGAIQVTERTFQRLQARYEFDPRETIDVKGKGPMSPYLLL